MPKTEYLSPEAQATKSRIRKAAEGCFAARGYARTSLRDIATEAGVTPPLVSHYFGSKKGVFDAVLAFAVVSYEAALADQWDRPAGELGFFVDGVVALFDWMRHRPALSRLMMWARLEDMAVDMPGADVLQARVMAHFEAGVTRGVLRAGTEAHIAMTIVDALIKGYWERHALYMQMYPTGEQPAFDTVMERGLLEGVLRMFLSAAHLDAGLAMLEARLAR